MTGKNRTTDFSTLGYNERKIMMTLLDNEYGRLSAIVLNAKANMDIIRGLMDDIGEHEEDK